MVNQKAVGQGVVHRERGFKGFGFSGTIPFRDGQEVYVVKREDWESLLHEIALSEHSSTIPPIEMPSKLARLFPLALRPKINDVATSYILDSNIYRPNNDLLVIRYLSVDEGLKRVESSSGNRLNDHL